MNQRSEVRLCMHVTTCLRFSRRNFRQVNITDIALTFRSICSDWGWRSFWAQLCCYFTIFFLHNKSAGQRRNKFMHNTVQKNPGKRLQSVTTVTPRDTFTPLISCVDLLRRLPQLEKWNILWNILDPSANLDMRRRALGRDWKMKLKV